MDKQIYQVWHANDQFAAGRIGRMTGMPEQRFPQDYRQVAMVHARDLEQAFVLTNHLDRPWWENEDVRIWASDARSTSEGDVIVAPDGKAHRVAPVGFEEIGAVPAERRDPTEIERPLTGDAFKALHREVREEQAFRDVEDKAARLAAARGQDFGVDATGSLLTRLEAFADEFTRLAQTAEQEAMAKVFTAFVADEARAALMHLPDPARDRHQGGGFNPAEYAHGGGKDRERDRTR